MMQASAEAQPQKREGLISAVADLRMGTLLSAPTGEELTSLLADLAAAAPELFASDRVSWELIFGRLRNDARLQGFQDIVLVSKRRVHIVLRATHDPYIALVGIAPHTRNVGLVLAEARSRLRSLEDGESEP